MQILKIFSFQFQIIVTSANSTKCWKILKLFFFISEKFLKLKTKQKSNFIKTYKVQLRKNNKQYEKVSFYPKLKLKIHWIQFKIDEKLFISLIVFKTMKLIFFMIFYLFLIDTFIINKLNFLWTFNWGF